MKKIKKILFIIVITLSIFVFGKVYAEDISTTTNIHLTIATDTESIYDQDIDVSACDSDNEGTLQITAYCAILQSGISNEWDWTWSPGAFITSINGISGYTSKDADDNDVYHYWSWSLNGAEGITALNQYELKPDDLITLNFIDPPLPEPEIIDPVVHHHSSGSSVKKEKKPIEKKNFDLRKALEFLSLEQKEDGSILEDMYTDWSAVAFASSDEQKTKFLIELIKYFQQSENDLISLTDIERHTMALMSVGLNPYNLNGKNYIKKITDSFDGEQFGDKDQDNDDIFALIVLQNAGYKKGEEIIQKTINFIISKQKEDGSWDGNVDMTAAAVEALASFVEENSLSKAKEYLKQNQKDDGGFGNISSTAWAMGGILSLSEKPEEWIKNDKTPFDYLAENQDMNDGGIKGDNLNNRIWQTTYAIVASSGKNWNQIMQKFDKPKEEISLEEKEKMDVKMEKILSLLQNMQAEQKILKAKIATAEKKSPEKIEISKNTEKGNKEEQNIEKQNTATVINSLEEKTNTDQKSWFKNILNKLFEDF